MVCCQHARCPRPSLTLWILSCGPLPLFDQPLHRNIRVGTHSMPTPLTLKQRLSALKINASSSTRTPGEQFASPSSPSMKWRPFSSRRGTEDGFNEVLGLDRIQEVMSRVVFQAGVDYESVCHPMHSCTLTNEPSIQNTTNVCFSESSLCASVCCSD